MRARTFALVAWSALQVLTAGCHADNPEYEEVFVAVCRTVEDRFFDPDFGGRDWDAIRRRHEATVLTSTDDESFHRALNAMLFELEVSHLGVVPSPEVWPRVEPTAFAPGSPGLDLRVLDGEVVITSVEPGSLGCSTAPLVVRSGRRSPPRSPRGGLLWVGLPPFPLALSRVVEPAVEATRSGGVRAACR